MCCLAASCWAVAAPSAAQDPHSETADYVMGAEDDARARSLEPAARAWLASHGVPEAQALAPTEVAIAVDASVSRQELEVLTRVESTLREARELSARFDEREALQRYSEAARLLQSALEIPHVHAWLAEVQLELGLCAAQLGAHGLAETALTQAASLDPRRTLQAAEAPPNVIALAREIERRRASAPVSQVRVEATPSRASLWLDGKLLGQSPQELVVTSGVHVLRVAAPGYHTYATLLSLGPGRREPVVVHLSETAAEAARRVLLAALREPEKARIQAERFAASSGQALWFFATGSGPLLRALVYRCEPDCTLVGTLGEPPALAASEQPDPAAAQAWLFAQPPPTITPQHTSTERPWWKRWPVWTAGAVAVIGAGVAAGLLATRDPNVVSERKLVLDPGQLPP